MGLFLTAILVLLLCIGSARGETESLCFQQTGTVTKGKTAVPVYAQADATSEPIAQMNPGDSAPVLGERDGFYRISVQGQIGYITQKRIQVTSEQVSTPWPEKLCDTLSLQSAIPARSETFLILEGTITADRPLDTLLFYIWDERQFQVEWVTMSTLQEPSGLIPMDQFPRVLPLRELAGGRKTLVIEGISGREIFVLYRSPLYVCGRSKELPNVNQWTAGLPAEVRDSDVKTAWRPRAKVPAVEFTVAAEAEAVIMTLEWLEIPESCTVETRSGDGRLLSRTELTHKFYADCVDLDPEVRKITVTPVGEKAALATVRLYAEPYSRHVIQRWEPVPEKLDFLIISTHQDDEFLFFGGTIPYYAAQEDVSTAVLYMANCNRNRYREALDALWTAGLKHHPIFLGLKDSSSMELHDAEVLWNRHNPLGMLIRVIRQYRPEVILVQDFQGEYGNAEHRLTARLTAEAVEKAAIAAEEPDSAEAYGTWQVKKLYAHLYGENQIRMDWNQPMDESGVITPLFLAKEAFDRDLSQTVLFSMDYHGERFDNTLFGLVFSTVGEDEEKNDFLENIKPSKGV